MPDMQTCQPERLEAFLSGQLSAHEEQLLTAHLESCELCRRQLDEAAAAPDTWTCASAFLKDDELDHTALSSVDDEPIASGPQIRQVLDLLNASDDPHMLGRLGSYEVSGVIGAGGMGIVLKAFDRSLDRTVAIKVMAPYLATSGAARQRFSREARAAAAIIHPNVIAIYGVTTDAALPYLVMPYVGGASLQKRLDREGPLPITDILRIGVQIAAGLAAAHDQGLVHRDIKPANILLDQGVDRLVITDFGLARTVDDASVTRTGVIAGTPQYMSPEQARGEAIDARSDLFSLGSVLYAACTGRAPFRAETPYGVLRRITDNAPRPIREINPLVPDWLCRIIERLHAKSPAERFQSAEEVTQLLTQCVAHCTQPTVHALPKEIRSSPWSLVKSKALYMVLSAGVLVAVVTFAWQKIPQSITTTNTQVSSGQPTASGSTAIPEDGNLALPWNAPEAASAWNDNLGPVFLHVEQTLSNANE